MLIVNITKFKMSSIMGNGVHRRAHVDRCGHLLKLRLGETHTPTYTDLEPAGATALELGNTRSKRHKHIIGAMNLQK